LVYSHFIILPIRRRDRILI